MLINRKIELEHLSGLFRWERAELFFFDGRRRPGKTELLRAFCDGEPHIFFLATLSADSEHLATFSQQVWGLIQLAEI
jgi:AAA+ ATPase superfamily predicted ATPase